MTHEVVASLPAHRLHLFPGCAWFLSQLEDGSGCNLKFVFDFAAIHVCSFHLPVFNKQFSAHCLHTGMFCVCSCPCYTLSAKIHPTSKVRTQVEARSCVCVCVFYSFLLLIISTKHMYRCSSVGSFCFFPGFFFFNWMIPWGFPQSDVISRH